MKEFQVVDHLDQLKNNLIKLNDDIWSFAETRFEEHQSANAIKSLLASEGFTIEHGVANIDTAFVATYGMGSPVIGVLAEYDALSGVSQKGGSPVREPLTDGGNGHGCGHNIFGASSVGAAIITKRYLEEHGLQGTVKLMGCPGEEGGSGKTFMAREGVFDDLDAALAWHPATINGVMSASFLANYQIYFKFKGITSHAAASPHLGRSALDAVELMNVGVNYLREHIVPEARVHYAVTETGGRSPNVVQGKAEVLYLIRAPKIGQVEEIYQRICKIARGAALMTETEVEIVFDKACSNVIPNRTLEGIIQKNFEKAGAPGFDEEDQQLAREMQGTLSEIERKGDVFLGQFTSNKKMKTITKDIMEKALHDDVFPYMPSPMVLPGSSDVGDVSWITPTAQLATACFALGTPAHSWQMVSQGNTAIAHKGMLKASEVLAMTAIDLYNDPAAVEEAKSELKEELDGNGYQCPIPVHVMPSVIK